MRNYIPLHIHSDNSLLQSAIKIDTLIKYAKEHKFQALTLMDRTSTAGFLKFYKKCYENDIKPLLGAHLFIVNNNMTDQSPFQQSIRGFDLGLIAKTKKGYSNITQLVSKANLDGVYKEYNRIDKQLLQKLSNDLICLIGGRKSELFQLIKFEKYDAATKLLHWYKEIFADDFYIEINRNNPELKIIEDNIIQLAKKEQIKLVVSGENRYLSEKDKNIYKALTAIKIKKTIHDNFEHFVNDDLSLRDTQSINEIYADIPEAIEHTIEIAKKCTVRLALETNYPKKSQNELLYDHIDDFLAAPKPNPTQFYPIFNTPKEHDLISYLDFLCQKGIKKRYNINLEFSSKKDTRGQYITQIYTDEELDEQNQELANRLKTELEVINNKGFTGYFIIVWDFVNYARKQKIPVGPGRGSGAGSLIAFLLFITNIDPIEYGLLFERFLNPERDSPPDLDIDFCEKQRDDVIDWVREKYGHDKVVQIGTYGNIKAKSAIKDATRILGYEHTTADKINKFILSADKKRGLKEILETPIDNEEQLIEFYNDRNSVEGQIISTSIQIENFKRNQGGHASGIVISHIPLAEEISMIQGQKKDIALSQFDGEDLENLGMLKMDFLGLRTLTIIDQTIKLIEDGNLNKRAFNSLKNKATYQTISHGDNDCIFQLESLGMKQSCKKMQIHNIEDLCIILAMFRPGPMKYIDALIERRENPKMKIDYFDESIKSILEPTKGYMVYQEQIMKIAQNFAGFTLGEADKLRRAIGKKKKDVMDNALQSFTEKATTAKKAPQVTTKLIDDIKTFANYGFNKSHSMSYAFLAYETAYLKTHHPLEFFTACLNAICTNPEKVKSVLASAIDSGVKILPPDLNKSKVLFTIESGEIRYSLAAILGIGIKMAQNIVTERETNGKFFSLTNICRRLADLNKKTLESLIFSQSLKFLDYSFSILWENHKILFPKFQQERQKKAENIISLFTIENNNNDKDEFSTKSQLTSNEEILTQIQQERKHTYSNLILNKYSLPTYNNWIKRQKYKPLKEQQTTCFLKKTEFHNINITHIQRVQEFQQENTNLINYTITLSDNRTTINTRFRHSDLKLMLVLEEYFEYFQKNYAKQLLDPQLFYTKVSGYFSKKSKNVSYNIHEFYPLDEYLGPIKVVNLNINTQQQLKQVQKAIHEYKYKLNNAHILRLIHHILQLQEWDFRASLDIAKKLIFYLKSIFKQASTAQELIKLIQDSKFGTAYEIVFFNKDQKKDLEVDIRKFLTHNVFSTISLDENNTSEFILYTMPLHIELSQILKEENITIES